MSESRLDRALAPSDPRHQAIDFYVGKGLTEPQARGIARRLNLESGIKPAAYNPAGGGMGAYGVGQWRGPRLQALLSRPDAHTLKGQLEFSWDELQGPEKASLDAVKRAKTEMQSYDAWTEHYERPGPRKEYAGQGGGYAVGSAHSDPWIAALLSLMRPDDGGGSRLDRAIAPGVPSRSPTPAAAAEAPSAPAVPIAAAQPKAAAPVRLRLSRALTPTAPDLRSGFHRALASILRG